MSNEALDNRVRIGKLATELPSRSAFDGLLDSARKRLHDAANTALGTGQEKRRVKR